MIKTNDFYEFGFTKQQLESVILVTKEEVEMDNLGWSGQDILDYIWSDRNYFLSGFKQD